MPFFNVLIINNAHKKERISGLNVNQHYTYIAPEDSSFGSDRPL